MLELLVDIQDVIRIDILLEFATYSLFYFIVALFFRKNKTLKAFDDSAVQLIIFSGLVWGVLELFVLPLRVLEIMELVPEHYQHHYFDNLGLPLWIGSLVWLGLSQSFRFRIVRKYLIFRVLIPICYVITFERFVIITTSIHRDGFGFNPISDFFSFETLRFYLSWCEIIGYMLLKLLLFVITVLVFHFAKKGIELLQKKAKLKNDSVL